MDSALLLKALILGIVEGATEFLPISSTGHLIIIGSLLGYTDEHSKVFKVVIQLAAILAVCWDYRARLARVATDFKTDPRQRRFIGNILIAFMPAVVFGLLFHDLIKAYLFNPLTVAAALIGGGILILFIEKRAYHPRYQEVDDIDAKEALKLGLAQTLAMFPGVSRSGATIMGGLMLGLSRKAAAEFSFFLAIPTMFAATAYDLYKSWGLLVPADLPVFAVGFVASFVSAMIAVKVFIRFVSSHTFVGFAWYRIVFGLVVLLTAYTGWVTWAS